MNIYFLVSLTVVVWNLIVFLLYAVDKRRAKVGKWRISEKTLLVCTFLCGAPGALAGMYLVRHKTRQMKFRILVPIALVLQIGLLIFAQFL